MKSSTWARVPGSSSNSASCSHASAAGASSKSEKSTPEDPIQALKATEQPIDTSTPAGKAFLDMLGVFAEFETNLRRERQMEGIWTAGRRRPNRRS